MKRLLLLNIFMWLLFQGGSAGAENIVVSLVTPSAAYMDHFIAVEKGYFREQNLSVEYVRAGGGVATPALLSGDLHLSTSAGSALSAGLRGGPVKIVYTNLSKPSYKLIATKPEIQSLKDLIGKKIAINSFGDTQHLALLLLLKKYRIPSAAVLFIAMGRNETRFVAVKSGAIDATLLLPRDVLQVGQSQGPVLADIGKEIQLIWSGAATSSKLLAENRGLAERFLTGAIKGREYARRFKTQTLAVIAKHDKSPREGIELDYDATVSSMTYEGWVTDDVLRDEIATRAELTKMANPPDTDKLFDYSLVKKIYADLKAGGWQPRP
ncbi:MAG TPA: ABC transporter substrate-binding protein [Candidatus Binatia bacterium]|nr:ABC transporter substrate-binding protein [Candidatus Binatia bacterium]